MRLEALLFVVSVGGAVWLATRPPVDRCLANCQLRSQELGCKNPKRCAEQCEKVKAAVHCKKPLEAFLACAYRQPKAHWKCGMSGSPELAGPHGTCEAEHDQMSLCLHRSRGKL